MAEHRKPTGKIGPIHMTGGKASQFQPVGFPQTKADIEAKILAFTLRSLPSLAADLYRLAAEPIQNPEQDFDFTLPTVDGDEYLDLMEVAPLRQVGGSYERASGSYRHGDFADHIWNGIDAKSRKYGVATRTPIHLLLYTTDWRFLVADNVLDLVAFAALKRKHVFKSMVYSAPMDEETAFVVRVFPPPESDFADFNEARQRARVTMLGDPSRMTANPDGSVEIPLSPPPPDWRPPKRGGAD